MGNYYKDNHDLLYYVERGLDWQPLVELTEKGFSDPDGFSRLDEALEFYRDILDMVGEFTAAEIAPRAAGIDRKGMRRENGEAVAPPEMDELFSKIRELELHGMCIPRELGGMNAPLLLYFLNTEIMGRADASVMAHHSFHGGIALAMLLYSVLEGTTTFDERGRVVDTRFRQAIEEIVRGEAWGSMDITEPDAGSDMASLRAFGEQDENGSWFVSGEKIFITSGHGKYHFVIARTEKTEDPNDPMSGLKGLSMFLVHAFEDDEQGNRRRFASLDRVEEKLGHHGSATCALTFDRAPAHLIGKRGEGFQHMLLLMNNARVGVGFECIGVCEAAYRLARDYARERTSMGKTIDRHELIADYLDEMATDTQGLRAMAMVAAWHEEVGQKQRMRLFSEPQLDETKRAEIERSAKRHARKARRITPLLKYLAAEKAVSMSRTCLQIHGGNGYMKDYGAEKLVRDALVMPVYEGTSQIQALMAMRDTLGGILKNPQRFLRRLAQTRWRSLSSRDSRERQLARIQWLSLAAQQHLVTKTAGDKVKSLRNKPVPAWPDEFLKNWNPKRDFAFAMLHAERLTKLLADEAICELLYKQAKKHPERGEVFDRYAERAEPRARFLHDEITSTGSRLLASIGSVDEAAEAAE